MLAIKAFAKFLEGKRQHGKLYITTCQQCRQFAGHEIRIRPCEVQVTVFLDEKTVYSLLILGDVLYFIKEDVVHFIREEAVDNVLVQRSVFVQIFVFDIFEIDADDLLRCNTIFQQVLLENLKEGGLAAAPDA